MHPILDPKTLGLLGAVLVLLGAATAVMQILRGRTDSGLDPALIETFRLRIRAWWLLFSVLAAAILIRQTATVVLFGLMSFWALREFITLTPTRPGDHRTLFWVLFLWPALQFLLVAMSWYDLYSIVIPVYAFLFIPARIAMAGDPKRFLERTAKIQAGLLICVYCLSYAPALLTLELPSPEQHAQPAQEDQPVDENGAWDQRRAGPAEGNEDSPGRDPAVAGWSAHARLLLFFVLIVQLSDALQYAWAQIPSKHPIVPAISPARTWEGLLGGSASVMLCGAALWWATPFQGADWWMAPAMSLVISLMSFAGGLTMSAIKRDRGVKDYGTLVEGHGGVLDRIDSICFAAPVFFHLTRWWLIS